MQNSKILEMLNAGKIEELKSLLQDEIYTESLKGKSNAKKRYTAMKKYLNTISSDAVIPQKPCKVKFDGEEYNSFLNSYSFVLTKEPCGEITMFEDAEKYPDVAKMINKERYLGTFDMNKVLGEAKSKGYKYSKNAINENKFLLKIGNSYFRIGLVDVTYSVINNNKEVGIYKTGGRKDFLILENDLGIAVILPVWVDMKTIGDTIVIDSEIEDHE